MALSPQAALAKEYAAKAAELKLITRSLRVRKARENMLDFTALTMPDIEDPDDAEKSRYQPAPHHRALCELLEKVERGDCLRAVITMPPRHGKSELCSKRFPAWFVGKDPYRSVMFATYSQEFAEDFGRKVREIMQSPSYKQVFPGAVLRTGSQAADRLEMVEGGLLFFIGAGGAATGRGADLAVIDDPFKNMEEADSVAMRQKRWEWFTTVVMTRLMPGARVIIIMTRWHDDDIVGRLQNPDFVPKDEWAQWEVLDLPAEKDGKALWPERYPIEFLHRQKGILGLRAYNALYMQKPTPDDGDYFKRGHIVPYKHPSDLPQNMKFYGASDHAVGLKQTNDNTVLGTVGLDDKGHVWVMPDLNYYKKKQDEVVEDMIGHMHLRKPMVWWGEKGHISSAIGPFLQKRMKERGVYCMIEDVVPVADKQARAQSVRAMMAAQRIHFPTFAPWWPFALEEMLKFPNGKHDDFVDWLAWIGRGVHRVIHGAGPDEPTAKLPRVGTIGWIKWAAGRERKKQQQLETVGGY